MKPHEKMKPHELITGHIDSNSPFDINIEQQILNNYISNHKEKMKILYSNINKSLQNVKEKVISKANENREELPETIPTKVFVRNKQYQSKTKNKYQAEEISKINKERKTAKIKTRHKNTAENIHFSNVKRPKRKPYKFSGTSQSDAQQSK
uniref:Uncharacterized protein LOC114348839 n=2 Tax=Diabrotica virgifera virgifera TaxID=50390 RepID=A0A6P7HBT0_DIAVI